MINDLTIHYITKSHKLCSLVNSFLTDGVSIDGLAGLDTEGTGLDPHSSEVRLIQIAVSDSIVYVIDRFKVGREFTDTQLIKLFSNDKRTTYVGHNLKYDIKMFWSTKVDLSKTKIFDTMLSDQIINAGVIYEFSLAEVSERVLKISVDKTEQKSDWSVLELTEKQLTYAAVDAIRVRQIAKIQLKSLKKANLVEVFKLEMRCLYPTAAMEYFGIRVDIDKLTNQIKPLYESFFNESQKDFLTYFPDRYIRNDLFGNRIDEGIEVNSPSQVLKALQSLNIIDPLGITSLIQSTGKNVIGLLDLEDYPVINSLLTFRAYSKLLSSYVYSLPDRINQTTNRLHPYFNQCVSSGRFSSDLQQLPRPQGNLDDSVRSCFIPAEGYKFILSDFGQIELRIIAELIYKLTKDDVMLNEFLQGKDPYANTAALLSGMTYENFILLDKSEYKKRRQNAKAVRLGFNYGMGAKKLKNYALINYGVKISQKEADLTRKVYFEAYPGLAQYHNMYQDNKILEMRSLEPFNRRKRWLEYPGASGLVNLPVQSTSADIIKLAMATLYEELYNLGYSPTQSHDIKILLSIHDEIVLESIESKAEESKEMLSRNMVKAGEVVLKYCPVLAEAKIMDNLSQKD